MKYLLIISFLFMAGCQSTNIPTNVVTFDPPTILMEPPQKLEPIKKK